MNQKKRLYDRAQYMMSTWTITVGKEVGVVAGVLHMWHIKVTLSKADKAIEAKAPEKTVQSEGNRGN